MRHTSSKYARAPSKEIWQRDARYRTCHERHRSHDAPSCLVCGACRRWLLPEAEESLGRTIAQHEQLATSLGIADETALFDRFKSISGDIAALLEGVAILRELSPRTRDAILAAGEQLAVALIEALLRDREFPVRFVDAGSVIVTDENFGHATPIIEEITSRAETLILPQLRKGFIVLVQGFSGATLDGITTTMGSESSDLTATATLAAAMGAREIVIWKTLPGLYTADPEFVKTPKLIRSMSFDEAEEMGRTRSTRILFPILRASVNGNRMLYSGLQRHSRTPKGIRCWSAIRRVSAVPGTRLPSR